MLSIYTVDQNLSRQEGSQSRLPLQEWSIWKGGIPWTWPTPPKPRVEATPRPGPGARSSPSLWAAGPRPSLPDRLSPPLEQVAAVGHQTEHPRSLLPPPPIRATGRGRAPSSPARLRDPTSPGSPRVDRPGGQAGRAVTGTDPRVRPRTASARRPGTAGTQAPE